MYQRDGDDMTMSIKTAGASILMVSWKEKENNLFFYMYRGSEN